MAVVRALLVAAILSSVLLLVGCSGRPADLPAREIVDRATRKMDETTSFHMALDRIGNLDVLSTRMEIKNVEGDVAKPDRLHVQMAATLFNVLISLQVISIGNDAFITNPFNNKKWVALSAAQNPVAFFNPVKGVASILKDSRDVKKVGVERVDGSDAYHLRGQTLGPAKKALLGTLAGDDEITTDFWVDSKDFTVRRMRFTGAFLVGEPKEAVRTLDLSRYGQPVTIEPPI